MPVFARFIVGLSLVAFSRISAGVYPLRWRAESQRVHAFFACDRLVEPTLAQALDRVTSRPPLVANMGRTERYRSSVGRDHRGPSPVGLRPPDPPTVPAVYLTAAPPASRFPPPAPAGPTPPTGRGRQSSITVRGRLRSVSTTRAGDLGSKRT